MVHYWGRSAILPCVGLLVAWTESSGCPRRAQWQRRGVPPRTRARARARRHPALPRRRSRPSPSPGDVTPRNRAGNTLFLVKLTNCEEPSENGGDGGGAGTHLDAGHFWCGAWRIARDLSPPPAAAALARPSSAGPPTARLLRERRGAGG